MQFVKFCSEYTVHIYTIPVKITGKYCLVAFILMTSTDFLDRSLMQFILYCRLHCCRFKRLLTDYVVVLKVMDTLKKSLKALVKYVNLM